MSDQSKAQPPHEHEGFFERILHHHMGQQTEEKMKDHHEDHDEDENNTAKQEMNNKGEMDKMKDYLHEDEELEENGQTYAGLM
ncbi:hypothetical protein N7532_003252 [Penicillium argentinense]|uniref:Uncharacterized protein n=1 Tax=Penicillium argentinense TaxID=1131581 RepID=A0A9W9FM82_9EURO|nr:uncharacterized protein N7532_003252 [Penicillium argentinense]KAJ5102723.1 hypothetical protein N7532_003252 [Penicillium argentinense]